MRDRHTLRVSACVAACDCKRGTKISEDIAPVFCGEGLLADCSGKPAHPGCSDALAQVSRFASQCRGAQDRGMSSHGMTSYSSKAVTL